MRDDLRKAWEVSPEFKDRSNMNFTQGTPPEEMDTYIPEDETVLCVIRARQLALNANAVVTDKCIYIFRKSFLYKKISKGNETIPYSTITGITVGRVLSRGVVISITRAGNTDIIDYCDAAHAEKWVSVAREAMSKASKAGTGTAAELDKVDQLSRLKGLFDSGVLSEDEFLEMKKKIISSL